MMVYLSRDNPGQAVNLGRGLLVSPLSVCPEDIACADTVEQRMTLSDVASIFWREMHSIQKMVY